MGFLDGLKNIIGGGGPENPGGQPPIAKTDIPMNSSPLPENASKVAPLPTTTGQEVGSGLGTPPITPTPTPEGVQSPSAGAESFLGGFGGTNHGESSTWKAVTDKKDDARVGASDANLGMSSLGETPKPEGQDIVTEANQTAIGGTANATDATSTTTSETGPAMGAGGSLDVTVESDPSPAASTITPNEKPLETPVVEPAPTSSVNPETSLQDAPVNLGNESGPEEDKQPIPQTPPSPQVSETLGATAVVGTTTPPIENTPPLNPTATADVNNALNAGGVDSLIQPTTPGSVLDQASDVAAGAETQGNPLPEPGTGAPQPDVSQTPLETMQTSEPPTGGTDSGSGTPSAPPTPVGV